MSTDTTGDATPAATPPVTGRDEFERALGEQVAVEKQLTAFGDRVAARRRRLPMTPIEDHRFTGPDGPVTLGELFRGRPQLVLQSFMFHPDWEDGCPACSWAADNLPSRLDALLEPKGIAFAMVSRAPIERLEAWRERRGWDHLTWVSSAGTTFHTDWGWTTDDQDQPGYTYLLRTPDGVFVTYRTRQRGT